MKFYILILPEGSERGSLMAPVDLPHCEFSSDHDLIGKYMELVDRCLRAHSSESNVQAGKMAA